MISLLSANYQTGCIVSMTETLGLALLGGAADLGHGQCDDTCPRPDNSTPRAKLNNVKALIIQSIDYMDTPPQVETDNSEWTLHIALLSSPCLRVWLSSSSAHLSMYSFKNSRRSFEGCQSSTDIIRKQSMVLM